ncbi:glycosyltransferase 87 family protein [Enemella sp. A6]|uniref:glycosyltransferase 87 family protein n=1 Tax=Enemella sp. A6 TaxID=3440152 RepID=UPI003EBEA900
MSEQPAPADVSSSATGKTTALTLTERPLIIIWAVSRLLTLAIWAFLFQHVMGDVNYYWRKLNMMGQVGLDNTLIEYPTPVVGLLGIPWLLGGASQYFYVAFFISAMLILDGWLFGTLMRRRGDNRWATWVWILTVPALGPLSLLRFDMIPAVLAGFALLWYHKRPTASGALIGLGAATKLWPALLLAGLFADRTKRVASLIGFATCGFGLALYSFMVGGWQRLISPLTWQSDRGLQVESVWVVPAMIDRLLRPDQYRIEMSKYQAFEVFGPLTDPMLTVATISTVLGGLFIIALTIRAWRSAGFDITAAAWVMLAVTAVMIVTNKTFSPQYMLWLAGPAAVLVLGVPNRRRGLTREHRSRLIAGIGVVLLSALTQAIYPFLYDALILNGAPGAATVIVVILLAIRNAAILAATGWVCVQAWKTVRQGGTTSRPPVAVG